MCNDCVAGWQVLTCLPQWQLMQAQAQLAVDHLMQASRHEAWLPGGMPHKEACVPRSAAHM